MSIRKLADKVGLTDSRVDHILLLNRLSPSILRLALQGKLPPHIGLKDLTQAAMHLDWAKQALKLQIGTT